MKIVKTGARKIPLDVQFRLISTWFLDADTSCHFISNIEWYITVIVTINVKVNIYAHPWWSKIIDKCLWTEIFVAKLMKTVNDNIEIASFSLLIKLMFRTYPILYDIRTISNFHNKSHLWNLSMYTISKVQTGEVLIVHIYLYLSIIWFLSIADFFYKLNKRLATPLWK